MSQPGFDTLEGRQLLSTIEFPPFPEANIPSPTGSAPSFDPSPAILSPLVGLPQNLSAHDTSLSLGLATFSGPESGPEFVSESGSGYLLASPVSPFGAPLVQPMAFQYSSESGNQNAIELAWGSGFPSPGTFDGMNAPSETSTEVQSSPIAESMDSTSFESQGAPSSDLSPQMTDATPGVPFPNNVNDSMVPPSGAAGPNPSTNPANAILRLGISNSPFPWPFQPPATPRRTETLDPTSAQLGPVGNVSNGVNTENVLVSLGVQPGSSLALESSSQTSLVSGRTNDGPVSQAGTPLIGQIRTLLDNEITTGQYPFTPIAMKYDVLGGKYIITNWTTTGSGVVQLGSERTRGTRSSSEGEFDSLPDVACWRLQEPQGADVSTDAVPLARESLERAIEDFVSQLGRVDTQVFNGSGPTPILILTASVLASAASIEVVRRYAKRSAAVRRVVAVDSTGRQQILGFPELPGSWSQRL